MPNQVIINFSILAILCLSLFACASDGASTSHVNSKATSKLALCKSGDKLVSKQSQCLQDDAVCYKISNGWCTGVRGATCPNGSKTMKKGENCPSNGRCFNVSPSLKCAIELNY